MKTEATFSVSGFVNFWKNGEYMGTKNLIVDDGLVEIAKSIAQETAAMPSYIAIGTDGTAESSTDSSLVSETARESATVSRTDKTVNLENTFTNLSAGVEEAGLFSDSSGGTMFARTTFPVVNLETSDELTVSWDITVSAA